nr:RNA-directed DNA polymerase, eukaryota, reverse transcriptase zinc-binding domain protein [Tanacetum cinerariifolium]
MELKLDEKISIDVVYCRRVDEADVYVWRFLTDGSSMWNRFIKAIFGNKGALDTHKLIPRRSPWQDVILAIHLLQSKGDAALKVLYKRLYALEMCKSIVWLRKWVIPLCLTLFVGCQELVWRFLTDGSSMWNRFIKAIFGNKGALDTHKLIPRRSPWQDVILAIHLLQSKGINIIDFIQKKVGNGENTYFWDDSWLGDAALKVLYKRMPRGGVEQENYGLLCSNKIAVYK